MLPTLFQPSPHSSLVKGEEACALKTGGQGAMSAAVKTGRIAAGLLNPPHNFIANREGMKSLAFAGDFVRLLSAGIVALAETLERFPEHARRLTRALSRARAFARDIKSRVIPILKRNLRLDDDDLVSKIYDYHKQVETPDGRIEAALMTEVIRDTLQAKNISKSVAANQVFDFSYLPAR